MNEEARFIALLPRDVQYAARMRYWEELLRADLLKYRLADVRNPGMEHACWLESQYSNTIFFCFDLHLQKIIGEMTLEGLNGASSRVHFSVLPAIRGESAVTAALVLHDFVFALKRVPLDPQTPQEGPRQPYVETLVGVTPVSNRLAVRFIQRVGFKPIGIIPKAVDLAYRGIIDDGLLSIKTRQEVPTWAQEKVGLPN